MDRDLSPQPHQYVVAGFDGAVAHDMAYLVVGLSSFGMGSTINEVKDIVIIKDKNEEISPDLMYQRLTTVCMTHKIDMILVDDTSNQRTVFYLNQEFKKNGCSTLVVPYNFAGKNKQMLFGNLESVIHNQGLTLPKLEYKQTDYPFREMLSQLLYLQKTRLQTGGFSYLAPKGSNFYDDGVCALALFAFCLEYTNRQFKHRQIVDLGDEKYYIYLSKYDAKNAKIKKKSTSNTYLIV